MKFDERLSEFLDALTGDYIPAAAAEQFIATMETDHADELGEWLRANAVHFCTAAIGARRRSKRTTDRRRATARAFGKAAKSGDVDEVSVFTSVEFVVSEDNTVRKVGEMTGADHSFVASGYQVRGTTDLALAAFHRALSKKVGKKRTADVMSETTYERLRESFVKRIADAA